MSAYVVDHETLDEQLGYDADHNDPRQFCRHGTFIGSWWGPDYMCHACEMGYENCWRCGKDIGGEARLSVRADRKIVAYHDRTQREWRYICFDCMLAHPRLNIRQGIMWLTMREREVREGGYECPQA